MMPMLESEGGKQFCEGWKRKECLDRRYSDKVCLTSIWIAMGLVCRKEIVGLEIRPVFFNIMFFEDKCNAQDFSSNFHKQHHGAYAFVSILFHVFPIVYPNAQHNPCNPCLYVNNRVEYVQNWCTGFLQQPSCS